MAIYIKTNHDPVPDPPCPVCEGRGADPKVHKDGLAHPCPACNGSGRRDGDWRAGATEISPEFSAQLLARLGAAGDHLPDGASLRRWIKLGRIPED